jgi:hypothetical protein
MPWWAILYLVLLAVTIIISVVKEFIDKRNLLHIFAEFTSGALGFVFVIAIWNEDMHSMIGGLILPLLLYTITWDQFALTNMKKSSYEDLSDQENQDMDRYSKLFAILFVLPCYFAGGLLTYKYFGL